MKSRGLALPLAASVLVYLAIALQFFVATPALESEDGYQHFAFIRWIVATGGRLPVIHQQVGDIDARQEAAQAPLYYLASAGIDALVGIGDFHQVLIQNPAGGSKVAGPNQNGNLHRPFRWPPSGAELALRLDELLSVASGAVTVACTVLLAGMWFPVQRAVWWVAGLAISADSAFDYHSTVVNNDTMAVAFCSVAMVLLSAWVIRGRARYPWLAGVATGLAMLTKFVTVGLVGAFAAAVWLAERTWRGRLLALAKLAICLAVIDGWWMVRNTALYGDPTGVLTLSTAYQPAYKPFGLDNLLLFPGTLAFTFHTFFSMYGVSENFDSLPAFIVSAVLGTIGMVAGGVLLVRDSHLDRKLMLLAWPAILAVEVALFAFTTSGSGRYMFPGMASLAVICALGWGFLLRWVRTRVLGPALVAVALAAPVLVAWLTVAPVFAYPQTLATLPAAATPLHATFDHNVELLGYQATGGLPGSTYHLTLYWRASAPVSDLLNTFVHLDSNDPAYRAGGQYDGPSGRGQYPPSFWTPGQVIVDQFELPVAPDTRPDRRNAVLLAVRVGMYEPLRGANDPLRKVPTDPPEAADVGFQVATLKVPGQPTAVSGVPLATFGGLVQLAEARAIPGSSAVDVSLTWRALGQPTRNLTVFVQALSGSGQLVAQHDSYPLNGRYPTSRWSANELVYDHVPLQLQRPLQAGDSVIVGLYGLPDAQRLITTTGETFVKVPLSP